MRITRFEELEIWQQGRELFRLIFDLTGKSPLSGDFRMKDQMRASSGSIADNIAEGFDRGGSKEFIQFLSIAKGSCAELRSQIYRAHDCGYLSPDIMDELMQKTEELSGKITKLIKYLKTANNKGVKFNP